MRCHECGQDIEYVSTGNGVVPVDVVPVTIYTDRGHKVTGRMKHECKAKEPCQNESDAG